ncbi:phospholipase [Xylaria longipes]|nr:phospholipase [Xylaria longipes]
MSAPSIETLGPVKLLSIDGGGVRGLSALLLLEQLVENANEYRLQANLDALEPWQMFNMIGGTSTGGLIAVMLGRLRMPISECINAYKALAEQAFTPRNFIGKIKGKVSLGAQYKTEPLEAAIKSIIGEGWETKLLKEEDEQACKVFVVAHTQCISRPTATLRSYRNCRKLTFEGSYDVMHIWEACRATSAAVTFIEPMVVDGTTYSDGGLRYNNPVRLVHEEAAGMFRGRQQFIISLGTGIANQGTLDPTLFTVADELAKLTMESERMAEDFRCQEDGKAAKEVRYFRFNVTYMGNIGMEEAKSLTNIRDRTVAYLKGHQVREEAERCVQELARGV